MPQTYGRLNHARYAVESTLVAVLTARQALVLCMACLMVATGVRIDDASGEFKGGATGHVRCDRCDQVGAICATADA